MNKKTFKFIVLLVICLNFIGCSENNNNNDKIIYKSTLEHLKIVDFETQSTSSGPTHHSTYYIKTIDDDGNEDSYKIQYDMYTELSNLKELNNFYDEDLYINAIYDTVNTKITSISIYSEDN